MTVTQMSPQSTVVDPTASSLSTEQRARAIEAMEQYLAAPVEDDGKTPKQRQAERDRHRIELIDAKLKPLIARLLRGDSPLDEFKSSVDSINKSHNNWGFRGVKGQMFFNLVVNVADDLKECAQELKSAMSLPANDDMAKSRIRNFHSYVKRIGEQRVERGGSKQGRPKFSSIPFFLSYFWQIQDHATWPVYFTNGVNTMTDLTVATPGRRGGRLHSIQEHFQRALSPV